MSGGPPSEPFTCTRVLHDLREEIEPVQEIVSAELLRRSYPLQSMFSVRLALEEALNNAFRHGNRSDPNLSVTVRVTITDRDVTFEIEDQGQGFDPHAVPDPTLEENIEIPSGRGIMLMKAYMNEVRFLPPGNIVQMVYRRP